MNTSKPSTKSSTTGFGTSEATCEKKLALEDNCVFFLNLSEKYFY
jgi:hypothetical protein